MIFPSLSSSATFDLPPSRYSIGSGVTNSVRQLGSVFGIAFAILGVGSESTDAATVFTVQYSGLTTAARSGHSEPLLLSEIQKGWPGKEETP